MASSSQYVQFLQDLLPRGAAWSRDQNANITRLLTGLADELVRIDGRAATLLTETDPRQSYELLVDWERITGLPDDCVNSLSIVQARRDAVANRLSQLGGQSRQYFIDLAKAVGFTVTITEFRPPRVGKALAGDYMTGGDWRFCWRVNAPIETVRRMQVGSGQVGERLAVWGNRLLECTIERAAPAHTLVQYGYGNN